MEIVLEKKEMIAFKGITHIIEAKATLGNYYQENQELIGKVHIQIEYFINNSDLLQSKQSDLDFLVVLSQRLNDIALANVHFNVIDNQGVEMEYTLLLTVTEFDIIEDIKNEIYAEAEEDLATALDEREDCFSDETNESRMESEVQIDSGLINVVTSEESPQIMCELEETWKTYKVFYIGDDSEIDAIAKKYNKDISDIYEENDFNIKDKIIIQTND